MHGAVSNRPCGLVVDRMFLRTCSSITEFLRFLWQSVIILKLDSTVIVTLSHKDIHTGDFDSNLLKVRHHFGL